MLNLAPSSESPCGGSGAPPGVGERRRMALTWRPDGESTNDRSPGGPRGRDRSDGPRHSRWRPHAGRSVLDAVAFFTFHEACHVGALGAIRKALGLPGPAELAMARAGGWSHGRRTSSRSTRRPLRELQSDGGHGFEAAMEAPGGRPAFSAALDTITVVFSGREIDLVGAQPTPAAEHGTHGSKATAEVSEVPSSPTGLHGPDPALPALRIVATRRTGAARPARGARPENRRRSSRPAAPSEPVPNAEVRLTREPAASS